MECSEKELQAELNLAADGLGSGELAEGRVANGESRRAGAGKLERRGVTQIEGFGAELQRRLLGGPEAFEQREIEVARTGAAEDIAPSISKRAGRRATEVRNRRRHGERAGVEVLIETRVRNQHGLA